MSEDTDKSSKTEEPTEQRLSDAFDEGHFPQASEIGVVAILAAAYAIFLTSGGHTAFRLMEAGTNFFSGLADFQITEENVPHGIVQVLTFCASILMPIGLSCLLAGLTAGGMQTRFRLTPKVLQLKFSRLNPIAGLQNLFSKAALVRFAIDCLKFIFIGAVLYSFVKSVLDAPIFHFRLPVFYLGEFIFDTSMGLLSRLIGVLGIIAAISYLYQRRKVFEELRMTVQEVKEERKRLEISPQIKSAQRRLARRLLQKQMLEKVPLADVVITNPTHYAVVLKYEKGKDSAPMVLAKGENNFALRIIALAREHQVPRVENRPVARLLYKMTKVGSPIPLELYQAVAEILAHVYRTYRYYFHRVKTRRIQFGWD